MSKLFQEYNSLIQKILDKSKELGVYSVSRLQSEQRFTIAYKNSCIDKVSLVSSKGIGIYAFTKSGHLAFGSTNNISDEAEVLNLLENISKTAKANETASFSKAPEIYELSKQENLGEDQKHYSIYSIENIKIENYNQLFKRIENSIKQINNKVTGFFRFQFEDEQWRIIRTDETDVDFSLPKSRLMISLTLKDGDKSSTTFFKETFNLPDEILNLNYDKFEVRLKRQIKGLEDQLNAPSVESGHYPMVIDSDLCGMLTHEAFGHACESDAIAENSSVLADKNGKFISGTKVGSDCVNVIDHEEDLGHGFHPYGAFGNVREKAILVENGILKDSISDIFTAGKIGVINKNAERSEDYASPAIPRMSNTYLEINKDKVVETPDGVDLEDISDIQTTLKENGLFDKHEKILLLQKMMGGMVSTKTGDFMFGVGFVYEMSKDSIKAYKPCSFSGKVLEALKSIEGAYGKIEKDKAGFCGKSGQTVCVNTGGHMLVVFDKSDYVNIS